MESICTIEGLIDYRRVKGWFSLQKKIGYSKKSSIFAPREPAKPINDAQMCGCFYSTLQRHTCRETD